VVSEAFETRDFDMLDRDIHDVEKQEPVSAVLKDNDASVPVFDRTGFLERFGNDEELAAEILESFFQEVTGLVEKLVSAVKKDPFDPEYITACAHALKGAAANVNAEQLRVTALDIETRAGNGVQLDTLIDPEMLKDCLNRFKEKACL